MDLNKKSRSSPERLAIPVTRFTSGGAAFLIALAIVLLSEKELTTLHTHYAKLAEMAKRDIDLLKSHSIARPRRATGAS
jgi:formate/nitrite transporter FocA (FNT family)